MGKFTAEEIQIAKAVDLVDLAEQIGIPLKRKGRFYQAVGMDSVISSTGLPGAGLARG